MKKDILVIKLGGQFLLNSSWINSFMNSLSSLLEKEHSVIIVHGGGPQADSMQNKLSIPIKKINGRRTTDKETLMVVKMIYKGIINTELVAEAIKHKIQAIGLSGIDANLAQVSKRPTKKVINQKTGKTESVDFGYVGDITKINKDILVYLLEKNYVPIIACLGVDGSGQIYNINADSLATAIACQIKASKLIFITDVNGIQKTKDSPQYFHRLTLKQAKEMIIQKKITDGMIPKIENVETAIKNGIESVQIVGALDRESKWSDAFTNQSYGTVIYGGEYE
ncbi:acetylglutamate kinase [Candidatus Gottesmanbacteria bacterium CG11_big_fil_rev_8_21_14_0_20_37_11]|uniref:Acetylglutamate kinase n=3 Tax=Candidatus Gottesmaniibacteriota TaxID=1752720 RepID=A0A1J4TV39_9BACT|nr:MAG: acetylglutamate kinase [Candidatus Gottesmanbacteria bacterium CG1_02_37_22]PIP32563.1 MAG: acetylglutamate kinase [Candidatus Gottesmanbacteria bacterium CG23_combo_of_CG06-09_8_20_14_all_37_19]PIR08245.1 MAG: acetylglutamate kinase [Candidatus Gottesmanbacteria bacterium CG11_big_fil_rev_8_21_14_0_20_37_11]